MSEASSQKVPEKTIAVAPDEIRTTRRTLLKSFFGLLGAFGLGSFFYGIYNYLVSGAGAHTSVEFPLSEIPLGGTYHFQYGGTPGILFWEEDGNFKAFSLVCSHLACTVVWNREKKEFSCPCHDGLFDAEGNVLSGPPPSPLERWKVEVEGEKVVVGVA